MTALHIPKMPDYTAPHIFITPTIHLELPNDFKPDEILFRASPENRAFVLNAGCAALDVLLKKADSLTYKEAYDKATAEQTATWLEKKMGIEQSCAREKEALIAKNNDLVKRLEDELNAKKKDILRKEEAIAKAETRAKMAEAEANVLRASTSESNARTRAQVEEETSRERDRLSKDLNNAKAAAEQAARDLSEAQKKLVADIKQAMEEKSLAIKEAEQKFREQLEIQLKERSTEIKQEQEKIVVAKQDEISNQKTIIDSLQKTIIGIRAQVESETSQKIKKLEEELKIAMDAREQYLADFHEARVKAAEAAVQAKEEQNNAVRDAEQKIRDEAKAELMAERASLNVFRTRAANSAIKGKDNETDLEDLIEKVFSSSVDFKKIPKAIESGDLIIVWKGMQLMFEFKYKGKVENDDVGKALRDFKIKTSCDVLIFISRDSVIPKRKRYFDITTEHGRPAIWIGEFNVNDDKVVYLQMVGQVAKELVRLQKYLKENRGNDDRVNGFESKIRILRQYFEYTNNDLAELKKARNRYQRLQKEAWDELKTQINSVVDNFGPRLKRALSDEDQEEIEMMQQEPTNETTSNGSRSSPKQRQNKQASKENAGNGEQSETAKNDIEPDSQKSGGPSGMNATEKKTRQNSDAAAKAKKQRPNSTTPQRTKGLDYGQPSDGASGNSSETTTHSESID